MTNTAYIKTWIGVPAPQDSYESAGKPRGGGWGSVRSKSIAIPNSCCNSTLSFESDIIFSNFQVFGADAGPSVSEDSGDNDDGDYSGTSLMEVSNVAFVNFTGYLSGEEDIDHTATISCSKVQYVITDDHSAFLY